MDSLSENPRDMRVGELLNEFFDLRRSGSRISADEFLERHSDYADELRKHLHGFGLIEKMADACAADSGTVALTAARQTGLPESGGSGTIPAIEGYDLLKEIGRGGMGLVYKAVQRSTKRVVAIKVLLEGPMASEAARKRFEREISLAAQLRHPNIVPIYDSGVASGRMYYAMEYVHGRPLGVYVKENKLGLRDRIQLLARICQAVSHAHQRGVIHRDLKPSNILVDAEGEPHVHDFGLAKSGSLIDVNVSMTAQLVGTPAYMSPDQVAGDPGNVDTRTDVYSLGVVLYELMTEQLPYDVTPNIAQTLTNIQHAEPRSPTKLKPGIGDELETIVLKALAKHKDERYPSAAELGSDLERYLRGDPIQAKPATMTYLLRKAISRHRVQVVVASLVFAVGMTAFLLSRSWKDTRHLTQELRQSSENEQVSTASLDAMIEALGRQAPEIQEKIFQDFGEVVGNVAKKKQPLQTAIAAKVLESVANLSRNVASSKPAADVALLDGPPAAKRIESSRGASSTWSDERAAKDIGELVNKLSEKSASPADLAKMAAILVRLRYASGAPAGMSAASSPSGAASASQPSTEPSS